MDSRQSIGIVGAGVMGGIYARAVAQGLLRFRSRVVAVCDLNVDAARQLADEIGAEAFPSLDAMLSATRPDLVYLATPDHLHVQPFLQVMESRIPCLVEKPLATNVPDALAMRAAAATAGVRAEVNFSNHWNPAFMRAKEAIVAGTIGSVVGMNARLSNVLDYPVKYMRWASHTDTGWFLLSHVLDLAAWLTGGRAVEVTAAGVRNGKLASLGVDSWDIIQCLVRYDQAWSGLFEGAWVLPSGLPSMVDFKYEIVGTEGSIYIDTQDQMVHVVDGQMTRFPDVLDWTDARLAALFDDLGSERADAALVDAGVENTALLVALHESLEASRSVPVPSLQELLSAAAAPERPQ